MAFMVPDALSPDIKSNAEKRIFEWFKNAPGTDDWIVMHSMGISTHQRLIHGEIDFLVLAPELGMFVLEVKGGRVQRQLGKWRFINRYGDVTEKIRGPFDQAWEGIYSVRSSLRNKLDNEHQYLNNIIYGIGVMFPDIEYKAVGIDEEPWQVFDINDGDNVKGYIERIAQGALNTFKRLQYPVNKNMFPTKADVEYLCDLLRGDFDRDIPLRIKQKYADKEFIELTEEQSRCIEQIEDNPRILVSGTAGTGKTILAMEAVKKFVCKGERVALFCYNHLLATWLGNYFESYPDEQRPVYVGTFHSYMQKVLGGFNPEIFMVSDEQKANYYNNTLPESVIYQFKNDGTAPQFDRIIIDEAQDLITEQYLNVMDLCLQKGVSNGKWMMFGDFSKQAIYQENVTEDQFFEQLSSRAFFATFRLTKNCRNSQKICMTIENIVGVPEHPAFKADIDLPYVDFKTYIDMEDQRKQLIQLIKELIDKNIQLQDIVILSPYKYEDSVVCLLNGIDVKEYSVCEPGYIRFSTIQGFKGLESSTIILTDIENYNDEKLIYVGLSRARIDLHVFETEEAAVERRELFIERRLADEN